MVTSVWLNSIAICFKKMSLAYAYSCTYGSGDDAVAKVNVVSPSNGVK